MMRARFRTGSALRGAAGVGCALLLSVNVCAGADLDQLLYDAVQYGSTAEKRTAKTAARAELLDLRGEALRTVMSHVHIENVSVRVLADELVSLLKPTESAPVLADFLASPDPKTRKFAAYFLGYNVTPAYAEKVRALLGDEEAGGAAIRTLGKWHYKEALDELGAFTRHEKERWRVLAANALRDIGDESAVRYLIPLLNDPYFTVRCAAQRALRAFGREALEALYAVSDDAPDVVLRLALQNMGVMNDSAMIRPLKAYLRHDDWGVRGDAARALLTLEPEQAPDWLREAGVEQDHPFVRSAH